MVAGTLSGTALAQTAVDPDADLKARRPPHERQVDRIEAERLAFQRDLASREEACLKRFFASRCLDEIRLEHLRRMREFDLRKETELQALRDIEAEIRARNRSRRAEKKTESGS
jgi:hypothetical protein